MTDSEHFEGGEARAIVYCASVFELHIFLRMRRPLARRGWSMTLVSHRLSIWIIARSRGASCIILRPAGKTLLNPAADPQASASIRAALEKARKNSSRAALMQWNGQRSYGRIATEFARSHGMPTAFLELGNILPKLFVDPDGVNGESALAARPEILDSYEVSDEALDQWTATVIEDRKRTPVPQAKAAARVNWWFLIDCFGSLALRIPQPGSLNIFKKLQSKVRTWLGLQNLSAPLPDRPYVFFPMQVHDDETQLEWRQTDRSALAYAADYARERGLLLVVKPHPVESDTAFLQYVERACRSGGHLITTANSMVLVEGADAVVTISSTVALDVILRKKPLVILGDTFFADFTPRRVAMFAIKHLLDFEPYGVEELNAHDADRLVAIFEGAQRLMNADDEAKARA